MLRAITMLLIWIKGFFYGIAGQKTMYLGGHKIVYFDMTQPLWLVEIDDQRWKFNPVTGALFDMDGVYSGHYKSHYPNIP